MDTISLFLNIGTDDDLYGKVEPFWITLLQICVRTIQVLSYFGFHTFILWPKPTYFLPLLNFTLYRNFCIVLVSPPFWFLHHFGFSTIFFNIYSLLGSSSKLLHIFVIENTKKQYFRIINRIHIIIITTTTIVLIITKTLSSWSLWSSSSWSPWWS